jgi:hypothetical protein
MVVSNEIYVRFKVSVMSKPVQINRNSNCNAVWKSNKSIPIPCPCPYPCACPCQCLCPCLCQFKYGAMNIYVRHGNYIVDSQGLYEVARKLKGPLT